jgi:hypothetical protein
MKKITIAILMLLGTFSMASAELGVNVGISGSMGIFTAKGNEAMGSTDSGNGSPYDRAVSPLAMGSLFIEKTLGDYVTVGVDYVPNGIDSETATQAKACEASTCTQTIKVSFDDMTTGYLALNVTENFYVKAGVIQVDVISKESLDTGGTYGNTSMDGTVIAMGYNKELTNGLFVRAEGSYMEFDDISLLAATGETRTAHAKDIGGATGKISIGKSF